MPHIMISEVLHSPVAENEYRAEFIELYNFSSKDFDMSDCFVDDNNDGKGKDPLIPTDSNSLIKSGEIALVTGKESIYLLLDNIHIFTTDDTTLADYGLKDNESVQIICTRNEVEKLEASYDGSYKLSNDGFSVTISKDGRFCESKNQGGSPGIYEDCY